MQPNEIHKCCDVRLTALTDVRKTIYLTSGSSDILSLFSFPRPYFSHAGLCLGALCAEDAAQGSAHFIGGPPDAVGGEVQGPGCRNRGASDKELSEAQGAVLSNESLAKLLACQVAVNVQVPKR